MKTHDWNPDLYLKFNNERVRPSIDLVSRIDFQNPQSIIDIGCGPGNSTLVLVQRWPDARIVGADNSPAMIEKAKKDYHDQQWLLFDAGKDQLADKYDIIFSNATIQWIPKHDELIKNCYNALNNEGILAVQLPRFFDMPISKAINDVAELPKWKEVVKDVPGLFTIHSPSNYYDQLAKYFSKIDIWTTDYYHVMESHQAILEMMVTTGVKPYLERIKSEDHQEFKSLLLDRITIAYPSQQDGKVLYPFKRLFFVAKK
jgi:trans-aconitate 2-methyltransferase